MNPLLAFFSPYKLVIEIALIGALAVGAVWGAHQFLEHERDIGRLEVRAEWDKQIAKDKEAADKVTKAWSDTATAATTAGAQRDETIRNLSNSVAAAAGGLRDAVAKNNRDLPNYSTDALREATRIRGELLVECSNSRRGISEEAERLNSEKQTLIDAWPTSPPKEK